MQGTRGYKVKRQDGTPMTTTHAAEIDRGMSDVEEALGPLADVLRQGNVTIAHTNGKHPFLSKAGGLYHGGEKTITMGVRDGLGRDIPSLAHELTHYLDHEAGQRNGVQQTLYNKQGKPRAKAHFQSEHDAGRGYNAAQGGHQDARRMFDYAGYNMTNTRRVGALLGKQKEGASLSDEAEAERARVMLGPYWREPAEMMARLSEQYVATKLGRGGAAAQSPQEYEDQPGYWSKEHFAHMMPQVERELHKRLATLRGHGQEEAS
jgi:hypothetical protein